MNQLESRQEIDAIGFTLDTRKGLASIKGRWTVERCSVRPMRSGCGSAENVASDKIGSLPEMLTDCGGIEGARMQAVEGLKMLAIEGLTITTTAGELLPLVKHVLLTKSGRKVLETPCDPIHNAT